ncbi:MAG: preprotein translocase subunit SecY [Clostridiales bacterium]|jgi:preprotein translocase subunit SecY|nr:preprotein translocase subunit SecY [Clostridiales bacterium]
MFQTIKNALKVPEIRRKILITLFLLFVFRIGSWLPIPGVRGSFYAEAFSQNDSSLLGLISAISGGALAVGAFLSLGISPYINSSIIFQLLGVAIPALERMQKEGGEVGKRKFNQLVRYGTLVLALAQSIGVVINWANSGDLLANLFGVGTEKLVWLVGMFVVIFLVTGAMFSMWLGEKITELGIGNGISLLIFVGIIATAGQRILLTLMAIFGFGPNAGGSFGDATSIRYITQIAIFLVLVVLIFALIIFIDLAERRIPVQYPKQIKGRKQYGGQSTHIPIKVNANGVMPIIFASALTSFPQVIISLTTKTRETSGFVRVYEDYLSATGSYNYAYFVITALLIFAFAFFYSQIQFNPQDVARNLQQYGGFIPGIRPGRPTADYLGKINRRLTFFGAFFLAFIALVPSIIFVQALGTNSYLVNSFSATGLLIVVSIALEFQKQLEGQLMMKHYKGFLK